MIRDQIASALKDAEEAGNDVPCCTMRLMLAAIRDRDQALNSDDGGQRLDEPETIALLARMIAQREKSIEEYEQAGRMEEAERERDEIKIIRQFMPRPLTGQEYDAAIRGAIAETQASSIRDMGKVMGVLRSRYPGRIDFCDANARVKAALG
ncbi:GatB/YqeY domain-containing protein [Limibaculum sp. M0105]|uniref:GatB/YqeY domain-containing protein n=1 Tax=Thermohalobaculum xanthum TaxID=2753746 RepID=A0A8J7MAH9_9RHOB|nr:GatB/YqeY domain-containing protein [Thermohalobaculum xanthum]MBK0400800.1 GatB/YqeY domain-containing protein [Thermohalobaculum xanthum]